MTEADILLINPAVSNASQNRRINAIVNNSFPTSLGVLAAWLMGNDVDRVEIIDEQVHPVGEADLPGILSALRPPRIVGLSSLTINSGRAYDLANQIKALDESVTVIIGGIHPTVLPEEPLANSRADIVVRGEAEQTLEGLVKRLRQGLDYRDLPGLSFRADGEVVHNPAAPLLQELDKNPSLPVSSL